MNIRLLQYKFLSACYDHELCLQHKLFIYVLKIISFAS